MIYYVSKCFWLLVQPAHFLIVLIVLGMSLLFTRARRLGVMLLALDALLILAVASLPVGRWLIAPLENRFPPLMQMPDHVDGVIMLGGDENIAFTEVARRYPLAKLVFAGGGPQQDGAPTSAAAAPGGAQWMDIDTSRITFEQQSRNTFEDVVKSKALVHPAANETWILITPAYHMPRSIGLFRAEGWAVVPDPVGQPTGAGSGDGNLDYAQNLTLITIALKEWLGMFANRFLGHSESLFPGPVTSAQGPRRISNAEPQQCLRDAFLRRGPRRHGHIGFRRPSAVAAREHRPRQFGREQAFQNANAALDCHDSQPETQTASAQMLAELGNAWPNLKRLLAGTEPRPGRVAKN